MAHVRERGYQERHVCLSRERHAYNKSLYSHIELCSTAQIPSNQSEEIKDMIKENMNAKQKQCDHSKRLI